METEKNKTSLKKNFILFLLKSSPVAKGQNLLLFKKTLLNFWLRFKLFEDRNQLPFATECLKLALNHSFQKFNAFFLSFNKD